ncbi:MAG TPA: adenosylhomocysteinase [Terriglobales bacterium]|jgi:adenosylhomocysteinase|nr:adenosylhomocysteinase [Terriglobales bacterium]
MATTSISSDVKGFELADLGKKRIEWANQSMKVLQIIRKEFIKNQPLKGVRISACLHVTAETANLMIALRDGGADVALCASNPLSTQDDVAASLVRDYNIPTFAIKGEDNDSYYSHIMAAIDHKPQFTMDDGADLVSILHTKRKTELANVIGGTEETTTGVIRLRAMAKEGVLPYPIIAVNDADTKHLFDNRYGTGQSTIDGIIRATNFLLAGSKFVVAGYGWCGRGLASRARGAGAEVVVTEVDPTKALEAVMDGYRVMSMEEAAKIGDVFCTVTGNKNVLAKQHFEAMKDGAIISNSGHFNVEIDIPALEKLSSSKRTTRNFVDEYSLKDGRRINLLGEGRLINLAAAEGHPASVMDMSFADQALSCDYMIKNHASLEKKVYTVPVDLDKRVAKLKLESLGVKIDRLTSEQEEYLASWNEGT